MRRAMRMIRTRTNPPSLHQQNRSRRCPFSTVSFGKEHLVFKFTIMDPNIQCSKFLASANVDKVTPEIITMILKLLCDTLPWYGLAMAMVTCDVAGCNWVSYQDCSSMNTFRDALPRILTDKYPKINFNVKCLAKHPRSKQWSYFLFPTCRISQQTLLLVSRSRH